jgi:hypothetical protein
VVLWDTEAAAVVTDIVRLQRLVTSYADRVGCRERPLVVPRDQSTVWAWLSVPARTAINHAAVLEQLLGAASTVRAALGDPGAGVPGFVRSHRHAAVAQSVALAAGGIIQIVTPYTAVAGLSFLCQDLDRTREWVRETLGALAVDDEAHAPAAGERQRLPGHRRQSERRRRAPGLPQEHRAPPLPAGRGRARPRRP